MVLLVLLLLPLLSLLSGASIASLAAGARHPLFVPALALSLRTSLISLAITVVTGTPLAYWLATSRSRWSQAAAWSVELPIMLPPAVLGVALLSAYGRLGWLGPTLALLSLEVAFTEAAVVLAQVVVSAPFFVRASTNAFRAVNPDVLVVARTLGASATQAFVRVALPIAAPGLVVGASLGWARALGEFGATLLFAGNLPGVSQTLPLAIFSALETDVRLAVVFAVFLTALGAALLLLLRWVGGGQRPGSGLAP